MAEFMDPPRRSGRKRTRNPKYTDDARPELEALGIISDEEGNAEDRTSPQLSEAMSKEFDPEDSADKSEQDDGISSATAEVEDGSSDDGRDHGHISEASDIPAASAPRQNRQNRRFDSKTDAGADAPSRPVKFESRGLKRDSNVFSALGDSEEDRIPIIQAWKKWGDQLTTPSRLPAKSGVGGFAETLFQTSTERASIATLGWNWYHQSGGRAAFDRYTKTKQLSTEDALPYLNHRSVPRDFVWGPVPHQNLFNLPPHSSINLHNSWIEVCKLIEAGQSKLKVKPSNTGWCINLSETVHLLDWVPNRASGPQYLALATWPKEVANPVSSFRASGGLSGSIQVWEFSTSAVASGALTIDNDKPPRLVLVLCFDWGLVKQFKWCPAPRDLHAENDQNEANSLGLLALIADDGKLRILDVKPANTQQSDTEYRHYSTSAFESSPPDTVCTCLAWISSSLIAAGCANGYAAIWDISAHLLHANSPTRPLPIMYHSFHMSFIRAIISCQPSRSNFLITSAMDSTIRLTDIRAPKIDSVFSIRSRNVCPTLAWHEQSQHALGAEDTYMLKGINLRLFFKYVTLSNLQCTPLSLATSAVHPFVLVGAADGVVSMINPLRRLLARRKHNAEYIGTWFKHEWRRGRANRQDPVSASGEETADLGLGQRHSQDNNAPPIATDITTTLDFPDGLIRLTTGFAPKQSSLRPGESGVLFATIHEEQTGVRSVAWNPNLSCGGWAAAGTGSGLVIVEDLALDG